MLLVSIVMTTKAHAMAAKAKLAEPGVTTEKSNPKTPAEKNSEDLSKKLSDTKNISEENSADKPLLGRKSAGIDKKLGTQGDTSTSDRLRQMMAMVLVILVLGGVSWLVCKKFLPRLKGSAGFKGRSIKILETTYISPRQPVHLLQVGSKKLLIAGGKEGLRMLAEVTDDFSSVLDQQQPEEVEENL